MGFLAAIPALIGTLTAGAGAAGLGAGLTAGASTAATAGSALAGVSSVAGAGAGIAAGGAAATGIGAGITAAGGAAATGIGAGAGTLLGKLSAASTIASGASAVANALRPTPSLPGVPRPPTQPSFLGGLRGQTNSGLAALNPSSALGGTTSGIFAAPSGQPKTLLGR